MLDNIILSLILAVPAAGAGVIALLPRRGKLIQWTALVVSLITFACTLHLPAHYVYGQTGFQFVDNHLWVANPHIRYHVGVDGISMWLVVLTGFLAPIGVLVSWTAIETRTKEFYFFFLLQQTAMLGVFVSLDLILYYGFWELSLVPMAISIAMFGRTKGPQAAIKFFLYTFIPSALFLVAILYLYGKTGTFDFVELQSALFSGTLGIAPHALWWVALAFLFAFAVKVPVFPLHGWLPDAFSEGPTAMIMVLAGKLGLYSIVRFNLGLFPTQSRQFAPWMIALAAIGILYGALAALVQRDLKRLIAFATVSALSFCTLGIFNFTVAGLDGAVYQTINEGLIGGALLLLAGILYERYGTYELSAYGGLAAKLPIMVTLFIITTLALIGLPILSGFVGEFLVLSSTFATHPGWGATATLGVILSAAYMLSMIQKIFYGKQSALVANRAVRDVVAREYIAVWPMAILMLVMGVASPYWIKAIHGSVDSLADHHAPVETRTHMLTSTLPTPDHPERREGSAVDFAAKRQPAPPQVAERREGFAVDFAAKRQPAPPQVAERREGSAVDFAAKRQPAPPQVAERREGSAVDFAAKRQPAPPQVAERREGSAVDFAAKRQPAPPQVAERREGSAVDFAAKRQPAPPQVAERREGSPVDFAAKRQPAPPQVAAKEVAR